MLDDPSLFTAVTLKVYSNPAFRSGIVTDVVSTLMNGMGMGYVGNRHIGQRQPSSVDVGPGDCDCTISQY